MSVDTYIQRAIGATICALAALAGAAVSSASAAPTPGVWTLTGNTAFQQRGDHTSTALPDGRMLVAGGISDLRGSVSSTEVWNPATDAFEPGGCLGDRRDGHLAVTLQDGRVLIAAGRCDVVVQTTVRSAEIYDPATGAFTPTGSMTTARSSPVAARLDDGRVLVASDDTSEIFDPAATDPATGLKGRWTPSGFLHVPIRGGMSLTKLANGRVLLVGGESGGPFTTDDAELYDPLTGAWTVTGKPLVSRKSHVAALLPNGKVLIAGGEHVERSFATTFLGTAELYDPATGTWSATGSMADPHDAASGALLTTGKVLVIGGRRGFSGDQLTSEVYDPATATWSPTAAPPNDPHIFGRATRLANGRVLVTGSLTGSSPPEVFDPVAGTYSPTLAPPFIPSSTTLLPDGKVLGRGGFGNHRAAELYDPATNAWTDFGIQGDNRRAHTATLLGSGKVLFAGGLLGNDGNLDDDPPLASAELYDVASGISSPTGSLSTARARATATRLLDGRVLVAGGRGADGAPLDSAELYDPASGTWSAAGTLGARFAHSANLLPDGRVLVAGGIGASGAPLDSTELYDPAANSWSAVASLPTARSAFTATTLADGRVLVAGGKDASGHPLASVQIYSSGSGWSTGHPLATARYGHTANALAGNLVFVAGGTDADGNPLRSTEIYDPAAGSWSAGDGMMRPRADFTATTLADGRILAQAGPLLDNTAEVYEPGREPRGSFLPTGAPRYPDWSAQILLASGKVMALGGGPTQQRAELFNPLSERWSPAPSMTAPHSGAGVVLLADGRVLVAGGGGQVAEIYDRHTNSWTPTGSMLRDRAGAAIARLGDGRVLAVGGDAFLSRSTEVYDPATGVWTAGPDSVIQRGDQSRAVTLTAPGCGSHCGKALLAGGPNRLTNQRLELFDPATDTFSSPGVLSASRSGPQLARLTDGRVFVYSGGSAELYDATKPDAAATGFPRVSRDGAAIGPLPDGRVLLVNGMQFLTPLPSAEVWDPATGTWSLTGSTKTPRSSPQLTPLATGPYSACGANCGKVLVGGGDGGPFHPAGIQTAELYTPQPQVTGIDAAAGDVAGGSQMTITGHALASVSSVRFGSSEAVSFLPDEQTPDTKLTVTVPPHAAGTVDVRVVNTGGTSDPVAADRFTYVSAATAAAVAAAAPPPSGAAPDTRRPVIRNLRVSPARFAAGSALPGLGRAGRTGTTINFSLSERAGVQLTFAALQPGRRVGTSCRAATPRLAARPRCERVVTVMPRVAIADVPAGLDHVHFAARLSRSRRLTPGGYRLTVIATDAAGNRSLPKTARLAVIRRR